MSTKVFLGFALLFLTRTGWTAPAVYPAVGSTVPGYPNLQVGQDCPGGGAANIQGICVAPGGNEVFLCYAMDCNGISFVYGAISQPSGRFSCGLAVAQCAQIFGAPRGGNAIEWAVQGNPRAGAACPNPVIRATNPAVRHPVATRTCRCPATTENANNPPFNTITNIWVGGL